MPPYTKDDYNVYNIYSDSKIDEYTKMNDRSLIKTIIEPKDVIKINASIRMEVREEDNLGYVQQSLSNSLFKKLVESNQVKIVKKFNPREPFYTEYLAELKVVENKSDLNTIAVSDKDYNLYRYNEEIFTEDEVKEALRNTYPERFF